MNKRAIVFLEFLIGGIILGITEDIILIKILTNEQINLQILWILLLITIPFAFLGECVVDRIDFIKLFRLNKKYKKIEVFLEFLIFGVILGIIEDLIAFSFSVGESITPKVILFAAIIAIPFAFLGEVIIDRIDTKLIKK